MNDNDDAEAALQNNQDIFEASEETQISRERELRDSAVEYKNLSCYDTKIAFDAGRRKMKGNALLGKRANV